MALQQPPDPAPRSRHTVTGGDHRKEGCSQDDKSQYLPGNARLEELEVVGVGEESESGEYEQKPAYRPPPSVGRIPSLGIALPGSHIGPRIYHVPADILAGAAEAVNAPDRRLCHLAGSPKRGL